MEEREAVNSANKQPACTAFRGHRLTSSLLSGAHAKVAIFSITVHGSNLTCWPHPRTILRTSSVQAHGGSDLPHRRQQRKSTWHRDMHVTGSQGSPCCHRHCCQPCHHLRDAHRGARPLGSKHASASPCKASAPSPTPVPTTLNSRWGEGSEGKKFPRRACTEKVFKGCSPGLPWGRSG